MPMLLSLSFADFRRRFSSFRRAAAAVDVFMSPMAAGAACYCAPLFSMRRQALMAPPLI